MYYVPGLKECEPLGYWGILCTEAASGYWGLSSYDHETFPILFAYIKDIEVRLVQNSVSFLCIPDRLDYRHTKKISEHIYVTDKERTICDMIKYDCQEFHLLESVFYYYNFGEDADKLEQLAKEYGIYDRLLELRAKAEEVYSSGEE